MIQLTDMKILNGKELAEYIQERQGAQVRALRQAHDISPKLSIIVTIENPIIDLYMRLKQRYGAQLGVDVEVHRVDQADAPARIKRLNGDANVHGIIIQLPLADPTETEMLVDLVAPEKDVDALGVRATFDPATPMAIMWLLAGYNVDLKNKRILLVGKGKLVGAPLEKMLLASHMDVHVANRETTLL
jgi:methylenetetrahydrofolate dehydrogenase (NADP+)/methenyltetrahydrofolate cyclohydrolase